MSKLASIYSQTQRLTQLHLIMTELWGEAWQKEQEAMTALENYAIMAYCLMLTFCIFMVFILLTLQKMCYNHDAEQESDVEKGQGPDETSGHKFGELM